MQSRLDGVCVNLYQSCHGASVKPTGTATASIDFQDGSPVAYLECTGGKFACEDTGSARSVGTACGTDQVCDTDGACVACAAGAVCPLTDQPCKTGVISCSTASPVCVASDDVADGTDCGTGRTCLKGLCKTDDAGPCTANAECRDSCTCGDAQCDSRFCGGSCVCRYAPPGGACGDPLADGTMQPGVCDSSKACYHGQCLTQTGSYCTSSAECGAGHCTCIDATCIRLLCSQADCPCQWANSGSKTCDGPLMDGLTDLSCHPPSTCTQGKCQ